MKKSIIILSILVLAGMEIFAQSEPITLLFGGDCTFATAFDKPTGNDFARPFKNIPWFGKADISMVNFENCVSLRGKKVVKAYNFKMNPKYLEVMRLAGIDIVNMANNHVIDYGLEAFIDSQYYLDSMKIKHSGAGTNLDEARKPAIIEVKGKKFGFLGYYSGNPAGKNSYGTAPRNPEMIKADIKNLKENLKADYVIVNYHWGEEGSHFANSEQKSLAHLTIDAGADAVIGTHPHVLQAVETYKGRFICYSLGNFIFGGNARKEHDTMIFKLIVKDGVLSSEIIPIHVTNFAAYDVDAKKRAKILEDIESYGK